MKLRNLRTLAATALTATALTLAAPAATAQSLPLDGLVMGAIDNADCGTIKTTLEAIDRATEGVLIDGNTTRSQLATRLQGLNGKLNESGSPILTILAIKYSGKTADRAVQCKIVKEDTALDKQFAMSSQVAQFLPFVMQMSSAAKK